MYGSDYREDLQRLVVTNGGVCDIWDTVTSEKLMTLGSHKGCYRSVQFSPNGQLLVTGSSDRTVRLWRVEDGAEIAVLKGHKDWVSYVAFSPDGHQVVSGSADKTVRLWKVERGDKIAVLKGHTSEVMCVAFSSDGQWVISGSQTANARIWDTATLKLSRVLECSHAVYSIAISLCGKKVAVGCHSGIWLYDFESGGFIAQFTDHGGCVQCLTFSSQGDRLVSGSNDSIVRVWDITNNKVLAVFRGHNGPVWDVQFSSDGKRVISGSEDNTLQIWDIPSEPYLLRNSGHSKSVYDIQFSSDGSFVVSGSDDNSVRLWEEKSGQERLIFQGHEDIVNCVSMCPNGGLVAWVRDGDIVHVWDITQKKELAVLRTSLVKCIQFSPDGKFIAFGGVNVQIWSVEKGEVVKVLDGHKNMLTSVAFSRDGKRILSGSWDKTVAIWNVATGKRLKVIKVGDMISRVSFSPDDMTVAVAIFRVSRLLFFQVNTGKMVGELSPCTDARGHFQIIDGGKRVIAGGNTSIQTWDIASAVCINVLKCHSTIGSFSYHENGILMIGYNDSIIECWQNIGEEGQYRWQLKWTTAINSPNFYVEGLDATKVTRISYQNRQLLMQLGATGLPRAYKELMWKAADDSSASPTLKSPRENAVKLGFFKGKIPPPASTTRRSDPIKDDEEDSLDQFEERLNM